MKPIDLKDMFMRNEITRETLNLLSNVKRGVIYFVWFMLLMIVWPWVTPPWWTLFIFIVPTVISLIIWYRKCARLIKNA